MRKTCMRCNGEVKPATLDKVSAENKRLKITVTGMPVAKCRHGHASPFDNEFMLWLIRTLKEREGELPAGEEKGLIFKTYLCACGKELASNAERVASFPLGLAYEGAAAFKAELEMPVYKCSGCGKEQVRSLKTIRGHTSFAIARLNDAAGFPHSG